MKYSTAETWVICSRTVPSFSSIYTDKTLAEEECKQLKTLMGKMGDIDNSVSVRTLDEAIRLVPFFGQ
jgi:hypothetical protein